MMTLLVMLATTSVQAEQVDETVLTVVTEVPTVDGGQTSNWGTNGSENYDKLVDGDLNTKYGLSNEDPYVEFHYEKAIVPKGYGLWTANDQSYRTPPAWTIKAKLNASDEWTTLVDRFYNRNYDKLPMTNNISATFTLDNTKSYKYFRFEAERCSSVSGKNFQLAELRFYVEREAGVLYESQVTILKAINSTGAQAFNTGYTHKANTRIEMDCEVTKNTQRDWEALFGARLHDFYSNAFCFFSRHHKNSTAVNGPCFNRSGVETVGYDFVYDQRIKLVCENKTATWYKYSSPNTVAGSVTTTGTADDGKTPMFLFNLNTADTAGGTTADTSPSVMTLYSCKIYEGSTLMRDYVPAKYNNVVGLYDRVNKTFSGSITSTAFLAVNDPAPNNQADYERALAAIVDGQKYRVYTMYNGQKYYVTANGRLSTAVADAPLFEFKKVAPNTSTDGAGEYGYGFQIKLQKGSNTYYFSNADDENGGKLKAGYLNARTDEHRTTWEAQVFFLNAEGKYAIRSTNAKSGTTGWAKVGSAFWTVETGTNGPVAQYDYEMNYVWQLEVEDDVQTNYERALATIVDGQKYRVYTMYNNQKYYVTADGKLSTAVADAPLFEFKKVTANASEREYQYGFQLKNGSYYFTNPKEQSEEYLTKGQLNTTNGNSRTTWEAQVFFLNTEGKYAIRSTNSKYSNDHTNWGWIGSAFWTVNTGPLAEYSWDMNYLWEIEGELPDEPTITKQQIGDLYYNLNGDTKTAEVTFKDDADNYDANFQLTNFKDIVIPETVTYKGVEYEVTRIGDNAFREGRGMNSVTIPNTVTSIGKYAFYACVAIKGGIAIPESVTVIEEYAFSNSGITELNIPNSVTTVGGYIIQYANTTTLTIGKNVTSIDQYAFRSSNLKEIHSLIKNPTEIADETFYDDVYSTATLYVPAGTKTLYQNTNGWKKFSNIEEDESEFTGTELLTNGQCDGTYDGWTKTDGGDGWRISSYNGLYYWLSSYRVCKLTQTVNLSDFGISDEDVDNEKVICVASAEMASASIDDEGNGARVSNIIVDMLDGNDIQLATVTVLDDLNAYLDWTLFETKPFKLFPGTRKLRYTVRGQAADNYSGQWGPAYRNLSLQYMIGSQGGNNSGEPYSGKVLIGDLYYNLDGEAKTAEVTYRDDDYNSYSGSVAIPDKVTFRGTDYTVTTVGYEAFYDCKDLTSVTIPSSVTTIDSWAFQSCPSLTSFTIPRNVTKMGVNPFAGCNGLTNLNVESGNTKYDSRDGCNAIIDSETDVLIAGCNATVIPNTVKTLGQECFVSLTKMTSIVIPDGVETIGYGAFFDCAGLTSVDIANSVTAIDDYAFEECDNLSKITLPSQLETIGEGAFYNCDKLAEINLPNSLKSIGKFAFEYCSIKRIFSEMTDPCQLGDYAFYNIYRTATLVVPTGAKSNYQDTGTEWDKFSDIVDGEFKEIANADGILFYYILHPDNKTAVVTCKLPTEKQNMYSYSGDIVIPETVNSDGVEYTVTSIGSYAFRYCSGLTSLTIPNSVTSIGIRSIQYCPNLTTLTIPGSVTTIKDFAFNNCEGLTTVTLSEGIQSIGIAVFGGDIRLTSLTIPKSVTSIGDDPLWGCEALTSLEVESGNTKYDSRGGCNAIIETETNTLIQGCNVTVIPSDVKAIGDYSFYYFTGLTGINIPDGLETIGKYAFYECENLTSVVIPSSVTSIDDAAFWGCTALKEIHSLIETPFTTGHNVFSDDTYTNATLYVPIGTKSAYQAKILWYAFRNIVEEDYVVTYPVWVGETQVTDANKDNVLGDGTVTYEPGNGTGTLTFASATPAINGMYNAAKIYADGINLTIDAPKGLFIENFVYGIYMSGANSELTVNGDLTFKTSQNPIYSSSRININGNLTAAEGYTGINASYIAVNGNVNMKLSTYCINASEIVLNGTKHELSASSPCLSGTNITVTGDLTATSNNTPAINAKGDVTLVSGTWTLDGGNTRAIEWGSNANLNIPSTYAIIEPENAQIKSAGSGYNARKTVADAEGNEATHVVIGMMLDEEDAEAKNLNILAAQRGKEASFILKRTLKTGGWNTLASPVTFSDFTSVFGEGVKVKQLKDATLTDGVLNLKFEDATTIEAFTPYLVKVAADVDLSQKTITGIVCDEPVIKETAALKFIPTMGLPQNSHTDDPKSVLFIGAGSKLYYADALPLDIKGFRAYFVLNEPDAVRSVRMDFGDGATSLREIRNEELEMRNADEWYSVDGRKLSGRPTAKGVYINNGKKTIVK